MDTIMETIHFIPNLKVESSAATVCYYALISGTNYSIQFFVHKNSKYKQIQADNY